MGYRNGIAGFGAGITLRGIPAGSNLVFKCLSKHRELFKNPKVLLDTEDSPEE